MGVYVKRCRSCREFIFFAFKSQQEIDDSKKDKTIRPTMVVDLKEYSGELSTRMAYDQETMVAHNKVCPARSRGINQPFKGKIWRMLWAHHGSLDYVIRMVRGSKNIIYNWK